MDIKTEGLIMYSVVLGISGASGVIYAERLIVALLNLGIDTSIVFSKNAPVVINHEYPDGILEYALNKKNRAGGSCFLSSEELSEKFNQSFKGKGIPVYLSDEMAAKVASGSNRFTHMVILPCSMGCIGRIAHGTSTGLLERVADVALKERRHLIVVPRETPLNKIHLENLLSLASLGVTILPAAPAFYHRPTSIEDLVNFIVERILSLIGVLDTNKQSISWESES